MKDAAAGDGGAPATPEPRRESAEATLVLTWATYAVLGVLGLVLGVAGAFQHAIYLGVDTPVAAIGWMALLFAALYGMGRLMRSKLGALVPGVGWILVSMLLSGQRSEGDLVIAANAAGYLYLYGGFAAVVLAVMLVPSRGPSWLLRRPGSWHVPSDPS
ncbi:DUF6113 family protein [Thermostaphylospora chromogena]|uniref:Integral membrane protein n=1 Tax=Thermostaphylospora chromogena TaxID=35622 RepID=A0A1H1B1P8_9ACTN|nr:DUF6113 family protein [Thermostaphylospora chromogena]SDQ45823.1 hypothetical protein SAMN04489764_0756 [Thermostaphylospora chromogena]